MRNLIAISAPSGTGKSTLCEEVRRKKPEIKFSVSCTTRPKRNYEKDGINYYFLTEDEFNDKIDTFLHEELDSSLIHYADQIEVLKELRLYDFSHLDNPQTLGEVCYLGVIEELYNSGRIFDKDNYKLKIK